MSWKYIKKGVLKTEFRQEKLELCLFAEIELQTGSNFIEIYQKGGTEN